MLTGSPIQVTCSEPNHLALLEALTPIFNMAAMRPVTNMTTPTNVSVRFLLYGILGVNEKAQLLTTYLWQHFWWQNELVSWDPLQCGTDKISLPRNKFWVPDIVINEFMDEDKAPFVPYVNLYSDGRMQDAKPARVISSCNLDIYTFPFDIQDCTLTFSSFISFEKDLKVFSSMPDDEVTKRSKNVMTTLGEWELLDITTEKQSHVHDTEDSLMDELAFHIRLRRRSTLYVVNLLLPSCFLITVDLFSFLLPPQSVDRSSFKMTLILGYTVFLLIMNDLLPITGNTIPLINVFFSLCLALMVASLLETILITNLLLSSKSLRPVPGWIHVLLLQLLGRLVGLPWETKEVEEADTRSSAVSAQQGDDEEPEEEEGAAVEDKAVRELRSLGGDLKVIRLQVEQQLGGSQTSEDWMQRRPQEVKSSVLLFIFISLLLHGSCNSVMQNCSRPDSLALLEALRPVFNLSSIRPVVNISTVTHVHIDFILVGILGVDEKAQILTTYIVQYLTWRNEFVSWEPSECGAEHIIVPRKLLWIPDVVINEFMERNMAPKSLYSYLYHFGTVLDARPIRVVSSCRLDIYAFPFDIQNCTLTFNSYLHRVSAIQLGQTFTTERIFEYSKEMMTTVGEWELIGMSSFKEQLPTSDDDIYEEMRFFVSLRRRSTMYVVNLLLPSCFLITVDLFSFLLPPHKVDRSLFKMTLILGYTVFLLIMNDLLPITGNTIPLINVFLSLCLALMVASLLETVVITNLLHGSSRYSPVPRWIRVMVLHVVGRLVLLPPKAEQPDGVIQNPATLEMSARAPGKEDAALRELRRLGRDLRAIRLRVEQELGVGLSCGEWMRVGFIIDRFLFGIYVLFISVCFLIIIIMWVSSYNAA
uniref:5-hydroxytryptamine receptor 3A-like isoform X2 n=1 Tax=Doryrhamphus excisus TaxID=161450 RepID=UPI0025ADB787|nr:5-hydroxytryptamine receptor 3A-like isoform X2 [Doryrhamphus excisus]